MRRKKLSHLSIEVGITEQILDLAEDLNVSCDDRSCRAISDVHVFVFPEERVWGMKRSHVDRDHMGAVPCSEFRIIEIAIYVSVRVELGSSCCFLVNSHTLCRFCARDDAVGAPQRFSSAQKATIVRGHLNKKMNVSELCEEFDLQPSVFYEWQKQVFDDLEMLFEQPGGGNRARMARERARTSEVHLALGPAERRAGATRHQGRRGRLPNRLGRTYRTTAEAAICGFVQHDNETRLHSTIGYVTLVDKLHGRDAQILSIRDQRLEHARERRRERRAAAAVAGPTPSQPDPEPYMTIR